MEKRSNLFEIILYPESLPDYWVSFIEDSKVPCFLSPKHNLDFYSSYDEAKAKNLMVGLVPGSADYDRLDNIRAGVIKKEHYHLIVDYGAHANKSVSQVQDDFIIPLNAKKIPDFVKTRRGAIRYTIHLDHPEKAQYRLDECKAFNGFDVGDCFELSNKQIDEMCTHIIAFCEKEKICEYSVLVKACLDYLPWFNYVKTHTIFFTAFLRSVRHNPTSQLMQELKKDDETLTSEQNISKVQEFLRGLDNVR